MSGAQDRIAALVARGESEREDLALALRDARREFERQRARWRAASLAATIIAAAATMAYKLFGRASLAARLGRAASAVSLLIGLARSFRTIRRFW
jgi:aminopeptidase N